jgi:hypothetical protein
LDIRRLHALVTYATVPYFILHAFAGLLPLFDLIGFALAAMLLIVGMVEQFSLDRRLVLRLIGLICVVFFMVWAAVHIAITN